MKRFNDASEIKVGVVGYGGAFNMGRHHLGEMKKAGMTPVAVCEIDPERRKAAEQDYPDIQTYANLSQMLKQMEITGTKGSDVMDGPTFQVIQHRQGETVITRGNNPPSEGWRFYQNIADHLVKGEPLVITPEWARRPIHILDLACRSAAQGRALLAKYH